jgi:hypothetical protein
VNSFFRSGVRGLSGMAVALEGRGDTFGGTSQLGGKRGGVFSRDFQNRAEQADGGDGSATGIEDRGTQAAIPDGVFFVIDGIAALAGGIQFGEKAAV